MTGRSDKKRPAKGQPRAPRAKKQDDKAPKAGRPTKLSPEVTEAICKTLRAGNFLDTAISYAGLSRTTVRIWLQRGRAELMRVEKNVRASVRKEEAPYVEFAQAIEQAMAHAETLHVATITKAASKQWPAAAWMLERAHPMRWGAKQRIDLKGQLDTHAEIEVSGRGGGPVEVRALPAPDCGVPLEAYAAEVRDAIAKEGGRE